MCIPKFYVLWSRASHWTATIAMSLCSHTHSTGSHGAVCTLLDDVIWYIVFNRWGVWYVYCVNHSVLYITVVACQVACISRSKCSLGERKAWSDEEDPTDVCTAKLFAIEVLQVEFLHICSAIRRPFPYHSCYFSCHPCFANWFHHGSVNSISDTASTVSLWEVRA